MLRSIAINMLQILIARRSLYKVNEAVFKLGLRGIGIMNHQSEKVSGEFHFCQHFLPKNLTCKEPTIFDVGANAGDYSMSILRAIPNARVYAFEPHPKTFMKLKQKSGEKFHTYNLALSDLAGVVSLYDYAEKDGSEHASLYKEVIETLRGEKACSTKVEVVTLDTFLEDNNIHKIDLLKIDTEGNECKVLRGAQKVIENDEVDFIHFEFNEMNVFSRCFFRDLIDLLCGYEFYRMLPHGLIPMGKYRPVYYEIFAYQNIVAVRNNIEIKM